MNWPNPKVIEERLSGQNHVLKKLRFSTATTDRSHHAKLSSTDSGDNEHRLFIKRRPRNTSYANKELFAHRYVAPSTNPQLTPHLRAAWEDDHHQYLVTDDVGETHRCPGSPNPRIGQNQLISVIETYARLHANFWGKTDPWADYFQQQACLTVSHEITNQKTIEACQRTILETCLPEKRKAWGDSFYPEWEHQLPGIISRWAESFTQRCKSRRTLTLIHGDAHLGNVMIPRKFNPKSTLLIDWEGICIGIGAWDIARLLHHTRMEYDLLARFETVALENYYQALIREGVHNYAYEAFIDDYRLSILAYVPHTLVWGTAPSMEIALRSLERWTASPIG